MHGSYTLQIQPSNVFIACKLLGWPGGNVFQVARETGLTIIQIIKAEDIKTLIKKALDAKSQLNRYNREKLYEYRKV